MCHIDDSHAGEHVSAFRAAARRFCAGHATETFYLAADGMGADGFRMSVRRRHETECPIVAVLGDDAERSIFSAMEQWWEGRRQAWHAHGAGL